MPTPLDISIVILAAGAATRMKSPKQLLTWGNNTLITHTIETALELHAKEVIVVLGANYLLIEKTIKPYPITILNNKDWKKGLGSSIACGVQHIIQSNYKTSGVLITLADQPLIDAKFLLSLIQNFKPNKKHIVATSYGNSKNGVPALFDASYFETLVNLNNDYGAKHILNQHATATIKSLKPPKKNIDIDTKEDYLKVLKEKTL